MEIKVFHSKDYKVSSFSSAILVFYIILKVL